MLLLLFKTQNGNRNKEPKHKSLCRLTAAWADQILAGTWGTLLGLDGRGGSVVHGNSNSSVQRYKQKVLKINFYFKKLFRDKLSCTPRIQSILLHTGISNSPSSKDTIGKRTGRDNLAELWWVHDGPRKAQYSQRSLKWPVRPCSPRK